MKFSEKQIEYRQKHPRCKWCQYSHYETWSHWTNCCYWECKLKDKIIKYDMLNAKFCKYYDVDKGDVELEDEI